MRIKIKPINIHVLLNCWLCIKCTTWSSNTLRKSLLHHLKNNRSQEDTWHDNCVWWQAVVCWKPVQHVRAASAASHFKAKGADVPSYPPRLFERADLWPHHPHPDHVPLCMLATARPSNSRAETCIDYPIPWLELRRHSKLFSRSNIGLQLYHSCTVETHTDLMLALLSKNTNQHGITHLLKFLKSLLCRESEVVLTLASLLHCSSLWPHQQMH